MKKNRQTALQKFLPYLLFIFIGFCIADILILAYRDVMLPTQPPPAKPQKSNANMMVSRSNYSPITSRNIFSADGLIPDPLVGSGQKEQQEDEAPVPSNLPLALKGTIVHSNPEKSIANIEVKSKTQVIPYSVGRDIENLATVVRVERAKVILRNTNNGRLEFLEMNLEGAKLTFNATKPSAPVGDVIQTAPNTFEIKRSDLTKYTSDMASILQQASMAPRRGANGEIECFKFLSIQPGSIYTLVGLQNGDCISGANGEKIDSPAKAMEAYNMMKNSSELTLQFERDGRKQDNTYRIK